MLHSQIRNTIFNQNESQLKILVTGANGQLGRCLSDLAKTTDWNWIFTTRQHFDLTDSSAVNTFIKAIQPDIIVNTAAYTQVDQAEKENELAFDVNKKGVENLVKSVEDSQTKIIHISTDYVFEGQGSNPYTESNPVNPQSVYGLSKAAGEKALLGKISNRVYIIRTSWLYSEYGNNFVKTMLRLGSERKEINVVDDQMGKPTYANDLALGIIRMIEKTESENAPAGIYHFANKNTTTWFNFAAEIMKLSDLECVVNPIPTSQFPTLAKRPVFSALNTDKFESNFNFVIRDWEDALQECIDRINNH